MNANIAPSQKISKKEIINEHDGAEVKDKEDKGKSDEERYNEEFNYDQEKS